MAVNRRQFLGIAAAGSAALLAGKSHAESHGKRDSSNDLAVLVDTVVCIGCRKCEWACNNENELSNEPLSDFEHKSVFATQRRPTDRSYTVVNQFSAPEANKQFTIKLQCMHCLEPACVSACIVGALEKLPEGPVYYDAWECIGCRYCMVACPFQIPAYEYSNALDPKVQKCTFCVERTVKEGKKPACVEICPNEALTFGRRGELLELAHSKITAYPDRYLDHVYGEDEIGGTSWLYLAPTDFVAAGLPSLTNDPIPPITENIQHGIFKYFIPPIALYGLLGLIMASGKKDSEGEEQEVAK